MVDTPKPFNEFGKYGVKGIVILPLLFSRREFSILFLIFSIMKIHTICHGLYVDTNLVTTYSQTIGFCFKPQIILVQWVPMSVLVLIELKSLFK